MGSARRPGRIRRAFDRRERLHFLHIGKNAGTQIKRLGEQINERSRKYLFRRHPHRVTLDALPQGQRYFFSIRDPIRRFRSGFYSRQRKGQPRIHSEWSEAEALAFGAFEHANDLAEALFEDSPRGRLACCAMRSISHVARYQHAWLGENGFFLRTRPPVFILRTERFEEDLATLTRRLELDVELELDDDPVAAHVTHYGEVPALSPDAVAHLRVWYAADLEFYRLCEAWIEEQLGATPREVSEAARS